jgi:hypothetical protein
LKHLFHVKMVLSISRSISTILDAKAGGRHKIAFCPSNSETVLLKCLDKLDLMLNAISQHGRLLNASSSSSSSKTTTTSPKKSVSGGGGGGGGVSSGEYLRRGWDEFEFDLTIEKKSGECSELSPTEKLTQILSATILRCVKMLQQSTTFPSFQDDDAAVNKNTTTKKGVLVQESQGPTSSRRRRRRRGSSHPAEDLVKRGNKFRGECLPGGAARRGVWNRHLLSVQANRGIPPWQDRRGLVIPRNMHDNSGNDDDNEIINEVKDELEEVRRIRWKGREKAKRHTQRSMKASEWEEWGRP